MFELKKIPRNRLFFAQAVALMLIGILLLLTLCFSLVALEGGNPSLRFKENGYAFFDNFSITMEPGLKSSAVTTGWMCAFSWIIFILALSALIGGICCVLACFVSQKLRDSIACERAAMRMRNVLFGALITAIVMTFIYLIMGYVIRGVSVSYYEEHFSSAYVSKVIKSYAYFPFIISIFSLVAYLFGRGFLTETDSSSAHPVSKEASEEDRIELLVKYKELFDAGVLTQEEYDTQKKILFEHNP